MTEQMPAQPQTSGNSTDLVPLNYGREAWNIIHSTNLQTHSGSVTKEQAEALNQQNEIVLVLGDHGLPQKYAKDPRELPAQVEYQRVLYTLEGLEPGDVLFVESFGFPVQRSVLAERTPGQAEQAVETKGVLGRVLGGIALGHRPKEADLEGDELRNARMRHEVDLWGYAELYAEQKGIQVVYADVDAYVTDMITQGGDIFDIVRSQNEDIAALMDRVDSLRERTARNVVKDWLMAHPVPVATNGRRRKAMVVFGHGHAEGLQQAFNETGLQPRIVQLPEPAPYARAMEAYYSAPDRIWP